MASVNIGGFEHGDIAYGGVYVGDFEFGQIPYIQSIRSCQVNVAGIWHKVVKVWARVAGVWEENSLYARAAGSWKLIHKK